MAKRTNGSTSKQSTGESREQRAPAARRRTATKKDTGIAAEMTASAQAGSTGQAMTQGPTNDDIARLAYELYLGRGGSDGRDLDDWYEAERRLRGRG